MAEHMLILGLESPQGETTYIAAAFPSACGKTNLAMLVPPAQPEGLEGLDRRRRHRWMRLGPDGRLWAINPEAGFFGVAPGTSTQDEPQRDGEPAQATRIFTNVAVTDDNCPWWEGIDGAAPAHLTDWQGKTVAQGLEREGRAPELALHRAGVAVPVDLAALGRPAGRADLAPSSSAAAAPAPRRWSSQAFDWKHGVFVGATVASETTAAQTGAVGVVRRDPMAMLPFCGYNMGDYFGHWLQHGRAAEATRRRSSTSTGSARTPDGKFLWPGFGENMRVLRWMLERCDGSGNGNAVESPIGLLPAKGAIDTTGPRPRARRDATSCSPCRRDDWRKEADSIGEFFAKFGDHLPKRDEPPARRAGEAARLRHLRRGRACPASSPPRRRRRRRGALRRP